MWTSPIPKTPHHQLKRLKQIEESASSTSHHEVFFLNYDQTITESEMTLILELSNLLFQKWPP